MNKHQLAGKKTWEGKTKEEKREWGIRTRKKSTEKIKKALELLKKIESGEYILVENKKVK